MITSTAPSPKPLNFAARPLAKIKLARGFTLPETWSLKTGTPLVEERRDPKTRKAIMPMNFILKTSCLAAALLTSYKTSVKFIPAERKLADP